VEKGLPWWESTEAKRRSLSLWPWQIIEEKLTVCVWGRRRGRRWRKRRRRRRKQPGSPSVGLTLPGGLAGWELVQAHHWQQSDEECTGPSG